MKPAKQRHHVHWMHVEMCLSPSGWMYSLVVSSLHVGTDVQNYYLAENCMLVSVCVCIKLILYVKQRALFCTGIFQSALNS